MEEQAGNEAVLPKGPCGPAVALGRAWVSLDIVVS